MKVEILSRKLITPSSSTQSHLTNLKISCLDQFYPSIHAPTLFYYPAPCVNHVETSRKLQKSLSQTLTLFFPLAGRFSEDNLSIDCNDKGVYYLEAHVSGSLSQLLGGEELLTSLVPSPFQPPGGPLIMFQFNMFEDGGVVLGVCVHHKVADAFTFFTFIDAWATTYLFGIEKLQYCPSFGLSSLCPPRDDFRIVPEMRTEADKVVTRRFVFSGTTISKLKQAATDGLKPLKHQPTRMEVVTALIWRALIKAGTARHGRSRPSLFTFFVNMREKTPNLPVPKYSCGNFLSRAIARFSPDDERKLEAGFHELVRLVHDAKTRVLTRCAEASSGDDLYFMEETAMKEINAAVRQGETDVFVFSNWSNFPVYEMDFGFGKPERATPMDLQIENVGVLLDTKNGEGMEAWVCLDEKKTFVFQQNLDIIFLTSKL